MSALRSSPNGKLRVAVPNKGTLSEPAAEILSRPRHPYTRKLVGSFPDQLTRATARVPESTRTTGTR